MRISLHGSPGDVRSNRGIRGTGGSIRSKRAVVRDNDCDRRDADRTVAIAEHAVVIAGGGPTGLMLAGELALAGVDVVIVERRATQDLAGLRAGGLHVRTIEVLDQRGIADRFLSQGQVIRRAPFGDIALDTSDLPTHHNYFLALWQPRTEQILADWVSELAVPIYRGCEVTGFAQDETGVSVELSDGRSLRAKYLAGCDGGRSLVRKKAGIDFPGWDASTSYLIAEIETAEEPQWGVRRGEKGINAVAKLEEGKRARVVLNEPHIGASDEPTLRDLREALIAVYGTDYGLHSATYISRFTDMTRQAASYRRGRVLLAGDAAHVHSPHGGQGLNLGLQDAVNLGWKLAQVVQGTSPESLLETYHAERHPVGARVLRNTRALGALERSENRIQASREMMSELLQNDQTRKQYLAMMSGLDIHYDFGNGHPLLGRRIPDLDLVSAGGPMRVFTLLHDGRPVLLNLDQPGCFDVTPWADRVQLIDAKYLGTWELPAMGTVSAPDAVLIRPDGYVAWVGDGTQQGLAEALTTWFGPPTAAWRDFRRMAEKKTAVPAGCSTLQD
ncbi:MAG TPA: FAD-dependent monooxygenase [Terriglobales bacterium]|nr:FAD-dependent monooxygenase [Terriglobales bacterium]